jgi:hypothetical protein
MQDTVLHGRCRADSRLGDLGMHRSSRNGSDARVGPAPTPFTI